MKVLICGSRDWIDIDKMRERIKKLPSDAIIISGGAKGADYMAELCAIEFNYKTKIFPAEWHKYGKAAGPIRNQQMIAEKPDLVIAFQHKNSKGTQHTINLARKAGIEVEIHE